MGGQVWNLPLRYVYKNQIPDRALNHLWAVLEPALRYDQKTACSIGYLSRTQPPFVIDRRKK